MWVDGSGRTTKAADWPPYELNILSPEFRTCGKVSGGAMPTDLWLKPILDVATGSRNGTTAGSWNPPAAGPAALGAGNSSSESSAGQRIRHLPQVLSQGVQRLPDLFLPATAFYVAPRMVGNRVLLKVKNSVLRIYHDDELLADLSAFQSPRVRQLAFRQNCPGRLIKPRAMAVQRQGHPRAGHRHSLPRGLSAASRLI